MSSTPVVLGLLGLFLFLFLLPPPISAQISLPTSHKDFIYKIETRVVVEKSAVDAWMARTGDTRPCKVKNELQQIFSGVSAMFGEIEKKNDLRIRVSVTDISILSEDIVVLPMKKFPSEHLKKWLKKEENQQPGGKRPDLTLLFTGKDIHRMDFDTRTAGKICTRNSLGVVQLTGKKTDAIQTAHQVGHVLGAYDDEDSRTAKLECRTVKDHVMSNDHPQTPHFSYCSYLWFFYSLYDEKTSVECMKD